MPKEGLVGFLTFSLATGVWASQQRTLTNGIERWTENRVTRNLYIPKGVAKITADAVLYQFADEMGFDPSALESELRPDPQAVHSLAGTSVRYRQYLKGLPVYRGDVVIFVGHGGAPIQILNRAFLPMSLTSPIGGTEIDAQEALRRAKEFVMSGKVSGSQGGKKNSNEARLPFQDLARLELVRKEIVVVRGQGGESAQVAYRVSAIPSTYQNDWQVWIDASDGSLVMAEDRAVFHAGLGRVFDPDPRSTLRDDSLTDEEDANLPIFQEAYRDVGLLGLSDAGRNGLFFLSGEWARSVEIEAPQRALAVESDPRRFSYSRDDPRFEETIIYFHIDRSQRYIQSLGYNGKDATGIQMGPISFDAHGLYGMDNSHYVPSENYIAFGDGGVDDGEDADVILHEYGHALQHGINRDWGGGHERAMGEGFGDYWAASYTRDREPGFHSDWVFMWDGHNSFWPGRTLDGMIGGRRLRYPRDASGEVHDAGQLWAAALWDLRTVLGEARVADILILEHHFSLGSRATMEDAARAIVMADLSLYGGAHTGAITQVFKRWGMFP